MIDLSNVIALALGSDDVLQIQDAIGTVLWQKTIYYNVNISAGSNGTVSVNGTTGDYSQSVPSGTVLTIEGTGDTGYDFDEWSDGNTDNPRTITVTGDLTLAASFESAAPSVSINVTIINTDSYTGATYQIDSETAQPVNVTGNTTFTVPTTATTLTVNRNGKGETSITGVSGMNTDTDFVVVIPVQDMSSNVTIEFISLM